MAEVEVNQINQTQVNQTSNILGRWIPVFFGSYDMSTDMYFRKKELKNGLWVLYPLKTYAIPAGFKLIVQPELLDNSDSDGKYYKIKQTIAIARIKKTNEILEEYTIELLKPRIPETMPKYNLYIISMPGKHTGSGAYQMSKVITDVIYYTRTVESSRSGNHWIDYHIILSDINKDVEILYKHRGSGGSIYKVVYKYSQTGVETNVID